MSKIVTHTGRVVDLENPDPETVCIEDIAHSLSLQCRWVGQCQDFYSVAEHSVNALLSAVNRPPENPPAVPLTTRQRLVVLLHDAHEAYIGDMSGPFKDLIAKYTGALTILEDRWKKAVAKAFGFEAELADTFFQSEYCKAADNTCLYAENRALFSEDHPSLLPRVYDPVVLVECRTPRAAKCLFLAHFGCLSALAERGA